MPLKTKVSFWLIPSQEDRAFFQGIIDHLAQEYDAPVFMPHVTIYSGEYTPEESPSELLENAIQGIQNFSLRVDQLLYTDQFTKTLFVQFDQNPILTQISKTLHNRSKYPSEYVLNPHMSLIYQYLNEEIKKNLITQLSLPKSEICFNEVRAISTQNQVKGWEDVVSWEVIDIKQLQQP
ncbi:MAG TPA: hypothetical protein V6D26_07530 [Stenomitos sp.]